MFLALRSLGHFCLENIFVENKVLERPKKGVEEVPTLSPQLTYFSFNEPLFFVHESLLIIVTHTLFFGVRENVCVCVCGRERERVCVSVCEKENEIYCNESSQGFSVVYS